MSKEIASAVQQARILETALKKATTDKGLSFYSLNAELTKAGTSASKLTATLAAGGTQFQASLNQANLALARADRSVISLNSKIKEMGRVITQSFKFTAAQELLQGISTAAQEAYQWVYDLDKTITNIGVVTGYTGEQLEKVTQNAITGARELRIAANDYAEGALIFYQQGLGDDEVARRVEITAKAARAAGSSLGDMSSQLTAIWNTYKMTGDEMERAASVGAKMAGDTAVDFADIAEAMQTAAAPAEQMGVSYNSLAAIIATVGDTTQQSASVIGNAFKTIFSRFQQLKSEGTDGEVTLNRVSSQLQELGINVLDSAGELRSLDTVIAEVGDQWDNWSSKQQLAIAQLVGGTRQYGQFLTLMNNFDKYQDLLNSANMEDGSALEQQYQSSLESIESYAENAGEAWRRAFGQLFDEDMLKDAYKTLEEIGIVLEGFISGIGGLPGILTLVGTLLSGKIVPAITNAAKQAATLWNNLTPKRREKAIDKQYNLTDQALTSARNDASKKGDSAQVALINSEKVKNTYLRESAKINDQINTLLKTASGSYAEQLKYYQQLVQTSDERYLNETDNLRILDQQAQKQQKLLEIEAQRKREELQNAQEIVNTYPQAMTDQEEVVIQAERKVKSTSKQLSQAEQEGDEAKVIALTKQLAKERQNLTKQTNELKAMEDRYAKALVVTESSQNTQSTLKYRESLSKISTEFEKVANSSHRSLGSMKNNVKDAVSALQTMDIPDQFKNELNEIANLVNGPTFKNMKFDGLQNLITKIMDLAGKADQANNELQETVILSDQIDAQSGRTQGQSRQGQTRQFLRGGRNQGGNTGGQRQNFDWQSIASGFTQIGMAAMSTVNIVTSFFDIINNPDLSGWEKAGSIITSVLMGALTIIPTLISAFASLKIAGITSFTAIGTAIKNIPVIGWILAIVSAVLTLIGVLYSLAKSNAEANSTAKTLENASKAAEQASKAAEDAKAKYDDLVSSLDELDGKAEALEDLEVGTVEWKEAIVDANQSLIDLLSTYGMLSEQNFTTDENGLMTITDEAREQLLEQQLKASQTTQNAAYGADMFVNTATSRDQAAQFVQDNISGISGVSNMGQTTQLGADIGMALAEALNSGEITDLTDTDQLSGALEEVSDLTSTQIDTIADQISTNEQLRVDLQDLAVKVAANTEANSILSEQIISSNFSDQIKNSGLNEAGQEGVSALMGDQLENETNRLYEEKWKDMGHLGGGITDEEVQKAYAEMMGYGATENLDDNQGKYYTKEGEEIGVIDDEVARKALAQKEALEAIGADIDSYIQTVEELIQTGNDIGEGVGDAFASFAGGEGGSFGSLTKDSYDATKSSIGAYDTESSTFTINGETIDNTKAQALGYDTAQEYYNAIQAALDNVDWSEINDAVFSGIEGSSSKASYDAAKAFSDNYEKALKDGGEEAGQAFLDGINYMMKNVGDADQEKAFDALSKIDWSQWDAGEQAADVMRGLGYEVNTTTEEWDNFVKSMRDSMDAVPDMDSLIADLQSMREISSDVEVGSIISEEDYQMLIKYNSELSRYFTILADGSAQFTGDPLDFQQAVEETQREQLNNAANAYRDLAKEQSAQYNEALSAIGAEGAATAEEVQEILNKYTVSASGSAGEGKYSTSMVDAQLEFLKAMDYSEEKIAEWEQALLDSEGNYQTVATSVLNEIGEAAAETATEFTSMGNEAVANLQKAQASLDQLALSADSAQEREELLAQGIQSGGTEGINYDAYGKAAQAAMNEEAWEGLDVEEVQQYSDYLEDTFGMAEEGAEEVARSVTKMNRGVETLADNWENWGDILKTGNKAGKEASKMSEEYAEALQGTKEAVSDLLDVSEDFIDSDFISKPENLELIGKAAEGDAEAIDELGRALAEDIAFDQIDEYVNSLDGKELNLTIGDQTFTDIENLKTAFSQALTDLQNQITTQKLNPGDMIDNSSLITKLNEMVSATGMSVEDANAMYRSMGFTPHFKMIDATQAETVPITTTYHNRDITGWDEYGNPTDWVDREYSQTEQVSGGELTSALPSLTMSTPDGTMPQVPSAEIESLTYTGGGSLNNYSQTNSGGGSPGGGGKGGGGGSTPSKVKKQSKASKKKVEDRYADITSTIDSLQKSIDRFNDSADEAWGMGKIKNMKTANLLLQQQIKNYGKLAEEAKDYMEIDRGNIFSNESMDLFKYNASAEYGKTVNTSQMGQDIANMIKYNVDGTIANREEILAYWQKLLDAAYNDYIVALNNFNTTYGGLDESEASKAAQETVDNAKGYLDSLGSFIDEQIGYLDQFDESAEKAYSALLDAIEGINEWMAQKVEIIKTQVEIIIAPRERDLSRLEDVADKMGDSAYKLGYSGELIAEQMGELAQMNAGTVLGLTRAQQIYDNINAGLGPEDMDASLQDWFKQTFGEEAWTQWIEDNGGMPQVLLDYMTDARDELWDRAVQIGEKAMEELDNIYQGIDDWFEEFDNMIEHSLDKTQSLLDFYQAWSDYIDPDKITASQQAVQKELNAAQFEMGKANVVKALSEYKSRKLSIEEAQKQLEGAQADYEAAMANGDLLRAQFYAQEISTTQGYIENWTEEMQGFELDAIDGMTELFTIAQEVIESKKNMAKNALGSALEGIFSTVDQISDVYNSVKNYQSIYLDDYDKNYELDTLQRTFDSDMEEMDIDFTQYEGMVEFQEKLNKYKEEGVKLTEEEVNVLQKEYDWRLKQIQLEEAEEAKKNAKTTMRLARDASGNYSYIYSQDQDTSNIADLEQQAADAEKAYRDAINQAQESFQDSAVETYAALLDLLDNYSEELYTRSPAYREWFDTQLDMLLTQFDACTSSTNQMFDIMGDSADQFRIKYEDTALGVMSQTTSMDQFHKLWRDNMVGEGYAIGGTPGGYLGAIIDAETSVAETLQGIRDEISAQDESGLLGQIISDYGLTSEHVVGDLEEIQGGMKTTSSKTSEMRNDIDTYLNGASDSMTASWGTATNTVLGYISNNGSPSAGDGSIIGDILNLEEYMQNLVTNTGNSLNDHLSKVSSWEKEFARYFEDAVKEVEALIKALDELEDAQAEKAEEDLKTDIETNGQGTGSTGATTPESKPSSGNNTTVEQKQISVGGLINAAGAKIYAYAGAPTGVGQSQYFSSNPIYRVRKVQGDWILTTWNGFKTTDPEYYEYTGWFRKSDVSAYKTGGLADFTGPAWLDGTKNKPELVLNAQDTENILSAVQLMRDSVSAKIAAINSRAFGAANAQMIQDKTQTIEQTVHIDATFPNVSVAAEIEEAFNTLLNQVAQYNIKK